MKAVIGPDGVGKSTYIKKRYSTTSISLKKTNSSTIWVDAYLTSKFVNNKSVLVQELMLQFWIYPVDFLRGLLRIVSGRYEIFDRSPIDRLALVIEIVLFMKLEGFTLKRFYFLLTRSTWLLPSIMNALLIDEHILLSESAEVIYARRRHEYRSLEHIELRIKSYYLTKKFLESMNCSVSYGKVD